MSLAIPTLTLIFLLAPGLMFRRGYFSNEFSQEYFKASFTDLLIATIFPGVLAHVLAYCAVVGHFYRIDPKTLAVLLSGTDDPSQIRAAFSLIYYNGFEILSYLLIVSVVSGILGYLFKAFIRSQKIDRSFRLFRFKNEWHYLFTGEILDFPGQAGKTEDVDMIYVDALVDCGEGSILYSGVLADYILGQNGGLDRIFLSDTRRRYLKKDNGAESDYYEMPGNLFVIPYSKIINLHITYYTVEVNEDLKQKMNEINIESE